MTQKPCLFIDFDGTLCHDKYCRSLPANESDKIEALLFGENPVLIEKWLRGQMSSEKVVAWTTQTLGLDYNRVWDAFVADCKTMQVSLKALNAVQRLRTKYKAVLSTDNMDCFTRFTVPALKLNNFFDVILNSADSGKLKGDGGGAIFQEAAGGGMGEAILIDNSPKACLTFEKLGGRALLVDKEYPIEFWLDKLEFTPEVPLQ